ncbi:hypothetical protein ADUPG1_007411, partial [Aduncisulcus paluster]
MPNVPERGNIPSEAYKTWGGSCILCLYVSTENLMIISSSKCDRDRLLSIYEGENLLSGDEDFDDFDDFGGFDGFEEEIHDECESHPSKGCEHSSRAVDVPIDSSAYRPIGEVVKSASLRSPLVILDNILSGLTCLSRTMLSGVLLKKMTHATYQEFRLAAQEDIRRGCPIRNEFLSLKRIRELRSM